MLRGYRARRLLSAHGLDDVAHHGPMPSSGRRQVRMHPEQRSNFGGSGTGNWCTPGHQWLQPGGSGGPSAIMAGGDSTTAATPTALAASTSLSPLTSYLGRQGWPTVG